MFIDRERLKELIWNSQFYFFQLKMPNILFLTINPVKILFGKITLCGIS